MSRSRPNGDFCFKLPSGAIIGGKRLGSPSPDQTILYFHGFPGSRIEALLSHDHAVARNIQIIALDRPGLGLSSQQPMRSIREVVEDQLSVLSAFSVQRFSIIGVSGGTPYALALREHASDRVIKTAIVSGLWNPTDPAVIRSMNIANRTFLRLAHRCPLLASSAVGCMATLWRFFPRLAALWFMILLPKADRSILRRREVARLMAMNIREALHAGVRGIRQDFRRIAIEHPTLSSAAPDSLRIWHGEDDDYVPVSMGAALAHHTGAPMILVPRAGHFMVIDMLDEVFGWIAG